MGYRSYGTGNFTLRENTREQEALEAVKNEGFEIEKNENGTFGITVQERKLYFGSKGYDDCGFNTIKDNFNGIFNIEGEENLDVWKLKFENGKIFVSRPKIVEQPFKEAENWANINE